MLFRPREPKKLFGVTIFPQGMIPRHRARLAETIGKAVGTELVSQDTITDALFKTGFFERKINQFVDAYADDLLGRSYPALPEALPLALRAPVMDSVSALKLNLAEHVAEALRSDAAAAAVERFVDRRMDDLLARRLRDTFDDEAFELAIEYLREAQRGIVENRAFEQRVRSFVSARVDDLLGSRATLAELFTPDAVAIIKERIDAQLPPIISQLAQLATSERTREQIGALIIREVDDYYGQLSFFKKMFISRERIYGEVGELVDSTLPRRIAEFLQGEAFGDQAREFLNSSIDSVFARPVGDLVGTIAPEKLDQLKGMIAARLIDLTRSEEISAAVTTYAREALDRLRPHTLRALLEHAKPDSDETVKQALTRYLLDVLRRPETAAAIDRTINRQIEYLLARPIGRPTDYLSADSVRRTGDALAERITAAAKERLPAAITEFDIGRIVSEKVAAFPLERLEKLVLSVAGQHLRKIELAGLAIGFVLGILQALYILVRFGLQS